MYNVFEKPWLLLITAIIALLVALILRRIFPEWRRWWQQLIPVSVIVVLAFALDFFVKTDVEKIEAVIETGVKAVENEDPYAIGPIIAADYRDSYHSTKRALMNHCETALSQRPLVEQNITRILSIDIAPTKTSATAIFTVRIVFDKESVVYQNFRRLMLAKLNLRLQKQKDKSWLIDQAELLEIDTQPVNWKTFREAASW